MVVHETGRLAWHGMAVKISEGVGEGSDVTSVRRHSIAMHESIFYIWEELCSTTGGCKIDMGC